MESSCVSLTAPGSDSKNDGQPVPLLNFADELKTAEPQPAHLKVPSLYSCSGPGKAQFQYRPCDRTATEQGQARRVCMHYVLPGGEAGHRILIRTPLSGPTTLFKGLVKGSSVPACRSTRYCAGVSS